MFLEYSKNKEEVLRKKMFLKEMIRKKLLLF